MVRDRLRATVSAAILVVALSTACAPLSEKSAPGALDPKIAQSSYIEEGELVALVVGTRTTRLREGRAYIPLELAIVNKGLEGLTVGRESFTLIDDQGNRYATVGREELVRGYGNVDLDRRLGEVGPVVRGRFQSFQQIPSTLTPSFDRPVERRLRLPRFSFAVDFIYFPKPPEGAGGRRFELFMDAPELSDPVFVRFEVARRSERKTRPGRSS